MNDLVVCSKKIKKKLIIIINLSIFLHLKTITDKRFKIKFVRIYILL